MIKSTRIALLLCGNLTGKAHAQNGGYDSIYSHFLQETAPTAPDGSSLPYTIHFFDVVHDMAYPKDEDEYDSIILTGSAASAYENTEWITTLLAFISRIVNSKPHIKLIGTFALSLLFLFVPIDVGLGLCFGHQIIARALGGVCAPNGGRWEIGPTAIQLTDIGKQIFGNRDTLTIQQMHRDHVTKLPPNFHLLASTDLSPNQGMVLYTQDSDNKKHIQVLTTQGHPEFTEPIVSSIIEQRLPAGVFDANSVQDAERRRYWKTDARPVVGKVIWDVIRGQI